MPATYSSDARRKPRASVTSPKSRITTRPSLVTMTLDGFTSRWTLPIACSAASPSASGPSAARRSPSSGSIAAAPGGAASGLCAGKPDASMVGASTVEGARRGVGERRLRDAEPAAAHVGEEIRPFDELHREEPAPAGLEQLVEADPVGMAEIGQGPELGLEAGQLRRLDAEEHLERHADPAIPVERLVDGPHAARAQEGPDLEAVGPSRSRARGRRQPRGSSWMGHIIAPPVLPSPDLAVAGEALSSYRPPR